MDRAISFLQQLESIINDRINGDAPGSYVKSLVESGDDRVLKKIGEEAGEVIIAAKNNDKNELLNESADLLFHLLITLQMKGCQLSDVVSVFESRHNDQ